MMYMHVYHMTTIPIRRSTIGWKPRANFRIYDTRIHIREYMYLYVYVYMYMLV